MGEREIPPCDGRERDRAERLISDMSEGSVTTEGRVRAWITEVKFLPKQCREYLWYELRRLKEENEFSREAYDELRRIYLAFMTRGWYK